MSARSSAAFDRVEEEFHARAAELGIADDVIVSGYVASDARSVRIFSEIDAFCYPLEEGITARRGSILACVQSGRPVIVTGPAEADEFDQHPRFKELIDRGAIVLVPRAPRTVSMPTALSPRSSGRRHIPRSISKGGGATPQAPCRRRSRELRHSLGETKPRKIVQAKHRHQKREPYRIGAIEEEALHRGQIEPEQPELQQQHRQRSAIAAAVGSMEIAQRRDHQTGNQKRSPGNPIASAVSR